MVKANCMPIIQLDKISFISELILTSVFDICLLRKLFVDSELLPAYISLVSG